MSARDYSALSALLSGSTPKPAGVEIIDPAAEIAAERRRQVSEEGLTPKHDDANNTEEMAEAAAAYALSAAQLPDTAEDVWPVNWDKKWFKPTTPRRDLIKAGALIVAEIERLDRAALTAALSGDAG